MVWTDEVAQVLEVRPGRSLFVRKVLLGTPPTRPPSSPTSPIWQLICLHGTCATELQFHPCLKALDELLQENKSEINFSCLMFDNIGCGQSPAVDEWDAYDNSEIALDLKAILEKYSSPELRTVVMAHSYAPNILIPLLLDQPDVLPNLKACIFLSTAVRSPSLPLADGGHVMMRLPVPILQCLQGQLTEAFLKMAVHPDHDDLKRLIRAGSNANPMRVAQAYHRHHIWATVPQWHAAMRAVAKQATNDVSCLILHGADDGVVPVQCGQYLHNTILPNATFVVLDRTSHMIMLEQPERVAQEILAFIQKL